MKHWQTLVTGVLATIAAIATVHGIHLQIAQSEDAQKLASKKRNFVSRALITQPLSEICQIQRDLAAHFANMLNTPRPLRQNTSYTAPPVDFEAIEYLAKCIEDADDRAANDLSVLISDIQVQQARLRPLDAEHRTSGMRSENFEEHAYDAVMIYARSQRLLNYARREDEEYYRLSFSEILRSNCGTMIRSLGIQERIDARMDRIAEDWLGN